MQKIIQNAEQPACVWHLGKIAKKVHRHSQVMLRNEKRINNVIAQKN